MQTIKEVQNKILYIMKFIDKVCRENNITYFIMGGTALGAARHGGFIPWDDDLDIFMTPNEYTKFKTVFNNIDPEEFVLQEWKTTPDYLEYAKIRMNGTTFIENWCKDRPYIHQGIYVDIMMLHKVPENSFIQKLVFYESKFVTLYGLSQRNWSPKSKIQKFILKSLNFLPCKSMAKMFYKQIYKYDKLDKNYKFAYWITPAGFKSGLFDSEFFSSPVNIAFEDTVLMGPTRIREYLNYRYGDWNKLPSEIEQKAAVHALIYDTEKDYKEYVSQNKVTAG